MWCFLHVQCYRKRLLIRYEVLKNETGLPYSEGEAADNSEIEYLIEVMLTEFMEAYSAGEIGDTKSKSKKKSAADKPEQQSLFDDSIGLGGR